jgi:hypothetical protein
MLGGDTAIFHFKALTISLYIHSLLLYSQFRHLTSMFIRSDARKNCSLSFVLIHEGILMRPLSLSLLGSSQVGEGGR